jgi:hypothetical protein
MRGGETDGKKPLGVYERRWDDNIKIDVKDVGCRKGTGLI